MAKLKLAYYSSTKHSKPMDARSGNRKWLTGANASYRITYPKQKTVESHAYSIVDKILGGKHGIRNDQRGIYACLVAQGVRTPPRGILVHPRYRDLPEKQTTTKEQQSSQGKVQ